MQTKTQKLLAGLSTIAIVFSIVGVSTQQADARMVFSTEEGSTNADSYTIDYDDSAGTGDVVLRFGTSVDETISYDNQNNYFKFSNDVSLEGNTLSNFRIENSNGSVAVCTASLYGRIYFDTSDDGTYVCTSGGWENLEDTFVMPDVLSGNSSDNYSGTGTLTFDAGTTLDVNGTFNADDATVSINGINNNTFVLDEDGNATDVILTFGSVIGESIMWDDSLSRFNISDDLNIQGNLTISGTFTGDLAANTVENSDIQNYAITSNKIGTGAVTTSNILDGTITASDIAGNTITASEIAANAITASELADNSVDNSAIQNYAISTNKISTGAITTDSIANGTITATDIANNTITAGQIANNTITASEIANNTITSTQIALNAITASELADNSVDTAAVQNYAITSDKIGTGAITSDKIGSGAISVNNLANNSITGDKIADGTITNNDIANSTINFSKMATRNKSTLISPEYPNFALYGDGSNNLGTLDADRDVTADRNYYSWTSRKTVLNDYDIMVQFQIPEDFTAWQANAIEFFYKTEDADVTDNSIDIYLQDTNGTADFTGTGMTSTTWTSTTVANTSLTGTYTAGDYLTFGIKLSSRRNGGSGSGTPRAAYAGELKFNYVGR